jgi:hypothetical protein
VKVVIVVLIGRWKMGVGSQAQQPMLLSTPARVDVLARALKLLLTSLSIALHSLRTQSCIFRDNCFHKKAVQNFH